MRPFLIILGAVVGLLVLVVLVLVALLGSSYGGGSTVYCERCGKKIARPRYVAEGDGPKPRPRIPVGVCDACQGLAR